MERLTDEQLRQWLAVDHEASPDQDAACRSMAAELLQARALLSKREEEQGGWQGMESAPKDGTEILIGDTYSRNRWLASWTDRVSGVWVTDEGDIISPEDVNRWMPVPELPAALLEGDKEEVEG